MTWHKIISVKRSFFGKQYKIKCEDGELFKKVPVRDLFGKPIVGAFICTKANMFLGIRYEIMLNQMQKNLVLGELSEYLDVLTSDEIIEMADILRNTKKIQNKKVSQTKQEYIQKTQSWDNGEKLKISVITQIVNTQKSI